MTMFKDQTDGSVWCRLTSSVNRLLILHVLTALLKMQLYVDVMLCCWVNSS